MITTDFLEKIVTAVRSGERYAKIQPELVRWLAEEEAGKGRNFKDTVRAVRSRLHQIGGAYLTRRIDYQICSAELTTLPRDRHDPQVRAFCRRMMALHASTRERLPVLEQLFNQTLLPLGALNSIFDLGCGLNPLAIPWMPLGENCQYFGSDIYSDMLDFLNLFREHLRVGGNLEICDLTQTIPTRHVQVALLLKVLPCLEQLDKVISRRLLEQIDADHILVSFPARSLGGRGKGMVRNYSEHFEQLIIGKSWQMERYEFASELVFRLSR
jgi:16S rRNA (guanine(1405)-N(7))-methyltransferase